MTNKSKAQNLAVKVEISIEQRDLELTTYKLNVTVPTRDAIVMEWLANQGAIESLETNLTKAVLEYFHQSRSQVKQALSANVKEQKLTSKKTSKKRLKTNEEKVLADK